MSLDQNHLQINTAGGRNHAAKMSSTTNAAHAQDKKHSGMFQTANNSRRIELKDQRNLQHQEVSEIDDFSPATSHNRSNMSNHR